MNLYPPRFTAWKVIFHPFMHLYARMHRCFVCVSRISTSYQFVWSNSRRHPTAIMHHRDYTPPRSVGCGAAGTSKPWPRPIVCAVTIVCVERVLDCTTPSYGDENKACDDDNALSRLHTPIIHNHIATGITASARCCAEPATPLGMTNPIHNQTTVPMWGWCVMRSKW